MKQLHEEVPARAGVKCALMRAGENTGSLPNITVGDYVKGARVRETRGYQGLPKSKRIHTGHGGGLPAMCC